MKTLKFFFLAIFAGIIFVSCETQPQIASPNLADTEWKIADHKFLGQDKNVENYSLTLHSDSENIENNWGTFVRFTSEGTFVSFDRQSCGNSCFTTVYGRYSLQGSATLILLVDSVNVNCTGVGGTNETQIRNGEKIKFDILNYSAVAFQLQKEGTVSNSSILGKWCSGDKTIVFTENMLVFDYFPQYLSTDTYFTYSLSSDSITFTFHQQGNFVSEKFKYFLNGDELTIYGFSNPFSLTSEARTNVVFARCEDVTNTISLGYHQVYTDAQNGFSLRLDYVTNDSRCPIDVNCIWSGDAEVHLQLTTSYYNINPFILGTLNYNDTAIVQGFEIKLVDLLPLPTSTEAIAQEDYTVKLLVRKIQ